MLEPLPPTPRDLPLVLLVDHDADTRDLFGFSLSNSGFAVDEAADGAEALAKVKSVLPDVVITDVVLPGIDGFALCREIKRDERTARIPVIAVSGYSTPTRLEEAAHAGFDCFILKPCRLDDLLGQIRNTIEVSRRVLAQSAELRAQSERLRHQTKAVCDHSASILKRLTRDDPGWQGPRR